MRAIRLLLGMVIIIQAIAERDILIGIAGVLFAGMAIFNLGCCSTAVPNKAAKSSTNSSQDITYEEVV